MSATAIKMKTAKLPGEGLRVALFATCINDIMFPETPKATVKILERLGCKVEFPFGQTCCGQPFTNTGYFPEGLHSVRAYAKAFEGYDYIVGPSGSCVGAVREQHPLLAKMAKDRGLIEASSRAAANTYDLSEFIVDVLGTTDVGAYFPHKVTMHTTCHSLRVTKVGDRPQQLLRKVKGCTFVELNDADRCCGFGGTFSVKNPDVSVSMGSDKVGNIVASGAEYVVAGDNSCLMHVGGLLSREKILVKPIHLAEVLASTEEETAR
ncbi:MAG: Fe-S oxidoreductase [Actinomycetales bacterium]|nr:MAG: Fe-S oxidoreductase [Actinomycetales bacterium]